MRFDQWHHFSQHNLNHSLSADHLSFSINRLVKQHHSHHHQQQQQHDPPTNVVDSDDEDNNNSYNHNHNIDIDEADLKVCPIMSAQMSPESGRGAKSHSRSSSRSRFESRSGSESPELEVDSPPASPALRIHEDVQTNHSLLVSRKWRMNTVSSKHKTYKHI